MSAPTPQTTIADRLAGVAPERVIGRLTRIVGLEAEARGVRGALGDLVWISSVRGPVPAEVVAVRDDALLLAPFGELAGVGPGAEVEPMGRSLSMPVGPGLIGRVLDALGRPIDGGPPIVGEQVGLESAVPHPLSRQRITEPLPLGVRAVDTLLPCGRGQRVGIFAGSGVGKSTLLGMLARGTKADVVVVGLVGERGREVREFLEDDLGDARDKVTAVVATSDEPPMLRLRAAYTATRVAEYWRDQGKDVLLLVDSLTRFAMAAREIGLAAGEPPATRGYPPSVFAELPRLLERAGPGAKGTITALYTVLVEGDDTVSDPVADNARGILDGHIVLSRRLASAGHYPTIDILESASRLAGKICTPDKLALAGTARRLLAAYAGAKELIEIGAYAAGADPDVDEALALRPALNAFLQQPVNEIADPDLSWEQLAAVLSGGMGGTAGAGADFGATA
jgi:flagellum-specific ATP synthase